MLNRKSLIVVVSLLSSSSIVALNSSYAAGAFADHEVAISRRTASSYPGLSLRGLLVVATAVFSGATYTREEGSKGMGIVSGRELPYVAAGAEYAATGGAGTLAVAPYTPHLIGNAFLENAVEGAGVADHRSSLTAHRSERDAVIAGARSKLRGGSVLDASDHDMLRGIDTLPQELTLLIDETMFGVTFEKRKNKSTDGYYRKGEKGNDVRLPGRHHYTLDWVKGLKDSENPEILFHITQYFDSEKKTEESKGRWPEKSERIYSPFTHHRFKYTIPKGKVFNKDQLSFVGEECKAPYIVVKIDDIPVEKRTEGETDCASKGLTLKIEDNSVSAEDNEKKQKNRAKKFIQALYDKKNENVYSTE